VGVGAHPHTPVYTPGGQGLSVGQVAPDPTNLVRCIDHAPGRGLRYVVVVLQGPAAAPAPPPGGVAPPQAPCIWCVAPIMRLVEG